MEYLPALQQTADDPRRSALEPSAFRQLSSVPGPAGYLEVNTGDSGSGEWREWLAYWEALTRHRAAIAAAAVFSVLLALAITLFQTPVYRAAATLEVQAQVTQEQPFQSISSANASDPYIVQTQSELLRSEVLQDRVYSKMLQHRADRELSNSPEKGASPGPLARVRQWLGLPSVAPDWDAAVFRAAETLNITLVKNSRIVEIASESTRPDVAADYVNTLIAEYIQQTFEERWSVYQTTGDWLTRAQADLKGKLEASERQLLDYARASGLVVTAKNEDIAEQTLVQMQGEVSRAQADRIAKESVYRTAMAQPPASLADVLDRGLMAQYQSKLADLRRELAAATTSLTPEHPKVKRLEAQIEELTGATRREGDNILNRMRTEYESALRREKQLAADFANQSKVLSDQDQKLIRYRMLQHEVDTYRKLYDTTLQKGKEASIASALRPVNARIVDSARSPRVPFKPNLSWNLVLGLLGGIVSAAALVMVRERADGSIRVPGSVPMYLNLRELGVIPAAKSDPDLLAGNGRPLKSLSAGSPAVSNVTTLRRTQNVESVELTTWNRKASLLAEAFRATLISILSSEDSGCRRQVILVTSPSPQEGKSTVITNLAIALAEINRRVLIVDADMRRPRIHTVFNQANTSGLSDLLREKTPCEDYPAEALARKTQVPRLFLLPSGPGCVNVSRLLYSPRMVQLVAQAPERLRHGADRHTARAARRRRPHSLATRRRCRPGVPRRSHDERSGGHGRQRVRGRRRFGARNRVERLGSAQDGARLLSGRVPFLQLRRTRKLTHARVVAVPGTVLLSRVAGCESPLQADRARHRMGDSSTAAHDVDVHALIRKARKHAERRDAVPAVLFRRPAAVDVLFGHADEFGQQPGREREPADEGLLPARDSADVGGGQRAGRLRDWFRPARRDDGILPPRTRLDATARSSARRAPVRGGARGQHDSGGA